MHAVVRVYRHLEVPGFKGYYAIRCGETTGISLTLFESDAAARAGHEKGAAWVRAHLADLYGHRSPEMMVGEVLVAETP